MNVGVRRLFGQDLQYNEYFEGEAKEVAGEDAGDEWRTIGEVSV